MREFFAAIIPWATIVFAASSMFAVGLGNAVRDILGPLRQWPQVLGALGTNFILTPALAYLLLLVFDLAGEGHAIGLFIVGAAAGAPFLVKLAEFSEGDSAFAASLLTLLLPATVIFLPIAVPLFVPGATVAPSAIAVPLILTMLLPLALGMALRPLAPKWANRAAPLLSQLGTISLVVLFVSIFIANTQQIIEVGIAGIVAAFALVLGAFVLGWLLGSRDTRVRDVVALGTAQRNIGAATVVATQSFAATPGVLSMVTAAAVIGMLVLFPLAFALRRYVPVLRRREA